MTGPLRPSMGSTRLRAGMLASVANLQEARLVLAGGADIIDLKNPAAGALGALDSADVRQIVLALGGQKPISATLGDLPMEPTSLLTAACAMADTGVDYVKIGFFPGGDWLGCLTALEGLARRNVRLVAVLFADRRPKLQWLDAIAAAGFAGAMLDTMDKGRGSLRHVMAESRLAEFVGQVHGHGLLCGLAGSLRTEDIAPLLLLMPDYLGFRGTLCENRVRTDRLSPEAVARVCGLLGRGPRT